MVDATAGHELLIFMDVYSGYNQIKMHQPGEDKPAFTAGHAIYCYKVMPTPEPLPADGQSNFQGADQEHNGNIRQEHNGNIR